LRWFAKDGIDLPTDVLEVADSKFHANLIKLTGVDIQWEFVPIGGNDNVIYNLLITEENLPHIITGSGTRYDELYEEGLIYDLTPYLPEYAPDYWAWLNKEENEHILNTLKMEDGAIVAFLCGVEEGNCYSKGPMIRKDWLDECGLDIPYTLEEWETVLIAFKEKYGIAPFSAVKTNWKRGIALASGTGAHGGLSFSMYVEDGVVKCAQFDEEWREYITTLARWYEMGLLSPDITNESKKTLLPKAASGELGFVITDEAHATKIPAETYKQDPEAVWISIPYPVPQKGDSVTYSEYEGTDIGNVSFITKTCTEEELITAIKLLNYGYTEAGINFYNYGIEGESWEYDENGEIRLIESFVSQYDDSIQALNQYSRMNDATCPSIKTNHYAKIRYDETTLEAFKNWSLNSVVLEYRIPDLRYTADEREAKADIETRIDTFMLPFAEKLVLGHEKIDENTWAEMEKELLEMGVEELIRIEQAAYDRAFGK